MKQQYQLPLLVKLSTTLLLVPPLSSCDAVFGKEIARLPINAISTQGHEVVREVSVQLKKDENIAVWSDMDMAYEGEAPVQFQVEMLKDGKAFNQLAIDPTDKNITIGEVKTSINGKTNWRFSGKNAAFTVPENATYLFRARLVAADNPSLKIEKAELVLKK
ncbi:hypothetical protein HMJ29_17030 [Hymenobacter taeanensis]|uniref:Uncharacterized protein n=1 Tax=Hymenobacter taeanensis TaxID=2735321 RepID=A0A6M6BKF3_9BACT|nr:MULTISPECIES: hypothetical protein [Hymenobacter]QJX48527.1 hypothetical protein HMJ29_17030 [Hymenobacter taeanensis]UOQ81975.1 hypothetical protein MUN83_04080 [Hymenobacter sp. 5414T-23]